MMMTIRPRFSRYVTALIMALIITATSFARADENAFTGLRTGAVTLDGAPATRLVIEMQNPINASLFLLDNPYRVVLDVPNADWDAGNLLPTDSLDATGLASYRYGRPTANTGRLVFEMTGPYAPVRAFILPPRQSGGHRLVIDVQDNGRTAFSVAKAALKKQPYIAEMANETQANTAVVVTNKAATNEKANAKEKPIAKEKAQAEDELSSEEGFGHHSDDSDHEPDIKWGYHQIRHYQDQ